MRQSGHVLSAAEEEEIRNSRLEVKRTRKVKANKRMVDPETVEQELMGELSSVYGNYVCLKRLVTLAHGRVDFM